MDGATGLEPATTQDGHSDGPFSTYSELVLGVQSYFRRVAKPDRYTEFHSNA